MRGRRGLGRLTPDAVNIGLCEIMLGAFENLAGESLFDQLAGALQEPKKAGVIRQAFGLSEVMRHDHDRIRASKPGDEVFNDATG